MALQRSRGRASLRNPCPRVNHTQTGRSHQKSQPPRWEKKPNVSRGQPTPWKCQKPVMRQTRPWFSLFNPSIAGLQMGRSEPGARQQTFLVTPIRGGVQPHQLLSLTAAHRLSLEATPANSDQHAASSVEPMEVMLKKTGQKVLFTPDVLHFSLCF